MRLMTRFMVIQLHGSKCAMTVVIPKRKPPHPSYLATDAHHLAPNQRDYCDIITPGELIQPPI